MFQVLLFSDCNETNNNGGIPWPIYVLVRRLHLRRGGRGEAVSKVDHFDSRRAGACLPPVDSGRKARRYAVFVD